MLTKIKEKRIFRIGIVQINGIVSDSGLPADAFEAGPALVSLAGNGRTDSHEDQLPAAQLDQLFGRQLSAAEVVRTDTGYRTVHMPVYGNERNLIVNLKRRMVGQSDNPVNFVLTDKFNTFDFCLRIVIGNHYNGLVAVFHQTGNDLLCQLGEKQIGKSRPQKGNGIGSVRLQASGITVYLISEFFRCFFNFLLINIPYRNTVDDFGNGTQRNTGFPGNIFHRRRGGGASGHRILHSFHKDCSDCLLYSCGKRFKPFAA